MINLATDSTSGGFDAGYAFWIVVGVGLLAWFLIDRKMGGPAKRKARREQAWALKCQRDARIICGHCGVAGCVRTQATKQRGGVSGDKAAAALFTGGWSMWVTGGLAQKRRGTWMFCENCGMGWMATAMA